jgi:hypothetical protein
MKTYFNYNQVIKSKDAAEAISMVHGVGPVVGFGSATIDKSKNTITLNPLPNSDSVMYSKMVGKQKQWNITKGSGDSEKNQTYFAGIAKDGTIFSSDASSITVEIQGSRGTYSEVLVFAYHVPVSEPIENPVSILAFWSESNTSFYTLYKKSIDPYYPLTTSDREINFNNYPGTSDELSYEALDNKALAACTYYNNNQNSLALIGIYGTGDNPVLGTSLESFALVPWDGCFPEHLNYTPGIHNAIKQSLYRLETIIGDNSSRSNEGLTSISDLLKALKSEILEEVKEDMALLALPTGAIILWAGDTIPDGWAEYSNAAGRVVVGYTAGGIQIPANPTGTAVTTILSSVGALYNPPSGQEYSNPLTAAELPMHRHGVGVGTGKQDNSTDAEKVTPQNWDNRSSSMNGSYGYAGQTVNVVNGGLYSSYNFTGGNQASQTIEQWNATKLPKAITLRYIIKIS